MSALLAVANPASHVPSVYSGASDALAVLVLLTEFAMLRAALLRAQVRLYAAQSLFVTFLAVAVAAQRGVPELYGVAAFSFALKVVAIPVVINRLLARTDTTIAGTGRLGVATMVLVSIAVAAFGFFTAGTLRIHSVVLPSAALSLAVAAFLVGFVLMIVRNDVVSQATGFFSLENGVSVASLVVAAGLPLIFEATFLFDLLVAVVAFGVLMRLHHARTGTLSTKSLTGLRG